MSNYIDAYYNALKQVVTVWERDEKGQRIVRNYKAPYYFYVEDQNGHYTSLYGAKLKRLDFDSRAEFDDAKKKRYANTRKYESDFTPAEKVLMTHYYGKDAPKLHYTLLDIEVDYDKDIGFSSPENPYAPINAITLFHQWKKEYVTFAVPPKSWGTDTAKWQDMLDKTLPSTVYLFRTEGELLNAILNSIEDSDVVSGWNSEFFDMPYLVRRTEIVLGREAAKRWSFREARPPEFREVERFNETRLTVQIFGRCHIDYLAAFKKFAFGGRSSYSLKNIANDELDDMEKIEYDGTLDDLYNADFNFFLRYNIRDTEILDKLDEKFKYIDLANEMTHANTVTLDGAMGSVRIIDTGIVNYCHYTLNLIIPDRNNKAGNLIEGALVLSPKVGLHEWIGSVDINSLYPSTMRSLNISPEKIIGQFMDEGRIGNKGYPDQNGEHHWQGIVNKDNLPHCLYYDDGTTEEMTGAEWYETLKSRKWVVSGFGTVFDQSNGQGIIPGILTTWYAERKQLQKLKEQWRDKAIDIDNEFGKTPEYYEAKKLEEFYDKKQMVKKLLLNSLYGAVINEYDRFYDPRMGASTTATGRKITGHMISKIAELLTGEYTELIKTTTIDDNGEEENVYTSSNDAIIYSDTDSCYFKTYGTNKDESIIIADTVGEKVNESFIGFMREKFLCTEGFDVLIKAGREVVADRGIFQAKKKYILRVANLDGKDVKPTDKKALKVMGGEIKKSDTPKIIQEFLKAVTIKILDGEPYSALETFVNDERKRLKNSGDVISLGVSKSVNKLELYTGEFEKAKRGIKGKTIPGNARAAINYNEMLKVVNDKTNPPIASGNKIKVFYVKPNDFNFNSIAIPSDMEKFPPWLEESFTVDIKKTEEKLIDMKLESIFNPIGWDVPTPNRAIANKLLTW